MFKDPGGQLKSFASLMFYVVLLFAVLGGIAVIAAGEIIQGVEIIIVGALGGWLSSLVLYAFGCIVDNIQSIRDSIDRIENKDLTEIR